MLEEPVTAQPDADLVERDEQSMQVMEYALAIVAVAAALILAVIR